MRFEPYRAFARSCPIQPRSRANELPDDLAFLERFGLPRAMLEAAAARATDEGVEARAALVAGGDVTETRYYLCLAHYLGVPFVQDWRRPRVPVGLRAALSNGRVELADDPRARWLLAPGSGDVEVLVAARRQGIALPSIAIATPSHLAAILRHRAQESIAYIASQAFPDEAPRLSARAASTRLAALVVALVTLLLILGGGLGLRVQADVLGCLFLLALGFRLLCCAEGLANHASPPQARPPARLPFYTVLVPLHDEADMVPDLVAALERLDYPRTRREVLFLIEADDVSTRAAFASRRLPTGFKVVEVPAGTPRTKPRALNAGLLLARGDLVTVFDAEDRPDPGQLRAAAARFAAAPERLACLQARLAIVSADSRLLPRLFAIEYALLFDVLNIGLARCGLPIALGGTSNHFRASALRAVGGWDAWNVTEDADLGLRLARFGYSVEMLDSTTWEEAPERIGVWFKQRRRWTKGWMQTLLVLARDLPDLARDLGSRQWLAVTLMLTNLVVGPLLTPAYLVIVAWRLVSTGLPAPHDIVEILEATLAFSVIVVGAFGTLWCGLVGARARGLVDWRALAAYLPYQLMICVAAWGGLADLVWRPYHWHKTPHGAAGRARPRTNHSAHTDQRVCATGPDRAQGVDKRLGARSANCSARKSRNTRTFAAR